MKKVSKAVMIILMLIYAIFNVKYIIEANFKIECFGASMILQNITNHSLSKINLIAFLIFVGGLIVTYLILIAKESKEEDKKETSKLFIFIAIVSVLAGIILPNNSSDVYYYIASGRADSIYGYDMYDVNFLEIQDKLKEDEVVSNSPAWNQKFIYGIVFSAICKFVGSIPVENTLVLLYAFKILNIIAHIINCYLIYKITKNNKMVLIYGLNPLIIFEGIINCHNDIYMVTFVLLALYLKKKNKIDLAVISIVLATLIKYIPVVLLPYIIWDKNNIKKMILYVVEFLALFFGINLLFLGDVSKILSVLDQTAKYANSLYLVLILLRTRLNVGKIALAGKALFCLIYFIKVVLKIKKETNVRTYIELLLWFFLLVITNFRCWYFILLFGLLPDMKSKDAYLTIATTIIVEFANYVIYYLGEGYIYGWIYFAMCVIPIVIYLLAEKAVEVYKEKKQLTT